MLIRAQFALFVPAESTNVDRLKTILDLQSHSIILCWYPDRIRNYHGNNSSCQNTTITEATVLTLLHHPQFSLLQCNAIINKFTSNPTVFSLTKTYLNDKIPRICNCLKKKQPLYIHTSNIQKTLQYKTPCCATPLLPANSRTLRLQFVQVCQNRTTEDWKNFAWSDES